MNTLKINILFIFLLSFVGVLQSQAITKRANFVIEEGLSSLGAFPSDYKIDFNLTTIKMYPVSSNTNTIKVSQGVRLIVPKKQTNKLNFIQKVIKSNLKLSFRLKCHMNFIITYQ